MKKTIFAVSFIVLIAAIASAMLTNISLETFSNSKPIVIIDAGHGDPDGGAIGLDGTHEADLNLQIALKIKNQLSDKNINCILTRADVNSVYTSGDTIHQKKVSDIKKRVEIAKNNKDAVFLSIHMNTYQSQDVCGAQVFFKAKSAVSQNIANEIQNAINSRLQPDNQKKEKAIPSNVYLFKNIPNECVLVECGFLSNQNDLDNLKNENYQNKLSTVISEALIFNLFGG